MPERRSAAGDALTALILRVFRLNGRLLDVAGQITQGTVLSAARWQVLGAVLPAPLSVANVARSMGLARQSVQRLADALVDDGLCEYRDNPSHQRAKLLAPTREGIASIARIRPVQIDWANRVSRLIGEKALVAANRTADALLKAIDDPVAGVRPAVRRAGVQRAKAKR